MASHLNVSYEVLRTKYVINSTQNSKLIDLEAYAVSGSFYISQVCTEANPLCGCEARVFI